jgi:hypothetical protein
VSELWCLAGANGVANFTELVLVLTEHRVFLRWCPATTGAVGVLFSDALSKSDEGTSSV